MRTRAILSNRRNANEIVSRLPLLLVAGLLWLPGSIRAQYNAEIGAEITPIAAERVPFVKEALFAGDGEPATRIAYPGRRPDLRPLAIQIQEALRQIFGLDADVLSSSDVREEDYRDHTVIHLGNIYTNPELLWFYLHSFTYADASWPGGDGWAIQQAYDPKGYGRNVLIVSASSDAGLEAGVARFVREIHKLAEPAWRAFIWSNPTHRRLPEIPRHGRIPVLL